MGVLIALETAVHHAQRVKTLTLVAAPGPTAHYPEAVWRSFANVLLVRPLQPALTRFARLAYKRLGFSLRDMTDEGALRTVVDAAFTDFGRHRDNISAARLPVLQTWADDDALVPQRFHEELARTRPDWKQLRFTDGGHDVQKFHGVEVGAAMRELISR